VFNGTAIGSNALVTQSNTLILGSINGVNGATAGTLVGIGTTAPQAQLHVVGDINTSSGYDIAGVRVLSVSGAGSNVNSDTFSGVHSGTLTLPSATGVNGNLNSFFGYQAGFDNETGSANSYFGANAGGSNVIGTRNSFFGTSAGLRDSSVGSNTF